MVGLKDPKLECSPDPDAVRAAFWSTTGTNIPHCHNRLLSVRTAAQSALDRPRQRACDPSGDSDVEIPDEPSGLSGRKLERGADAMPNRKEHPLIRRLWDVVFVVTFYPLIAILSAVSTVLGWTIQD
jgi:hypothetical protein